MKNKMPYTTYFGNADELCKKGDAIEYIQPWYTPISTTPENTGIAVGGIGSTFTLTPKGSTPNFSFIPGVYIDCSEDDINFNDFYISVMDLPSIDSLDISDLSGLERFLEFYPAKFGGKKLEVKNKDHALEKIKNALLTLDFYIGNKSNFARWHIEFSQRTKDSIEDNPNSLMTQILVAIDFFDGLLVNKSARGLSLTAGQDGPIDGIAQEDINYEALYPIAHYEYSGIPGISIARQVVSPIVKDDKKLCSLPAHWNQFEVRNISDDVKIVTLVQAFENLHGSTYRKSRDGMQDSACFLTKNPIKQKNTCVNLAADDQQFTGVSLTSDSPYAADIEGEVAYGVVTTAESLQSGQITVTVKPSVYTSKVGKQVSSALMTGRTNCHFDHGIYSGRESLSSLVCVQIELQPGETVDLRFVQVMDHSKIWIDTLLSEKAYVNYFPDELRASAIIQELLPQLDAIEEKIVQQQNEFLHRAEEAIEDAHCAEQFSTMAMNTLSFLAESTVWDKKDRFLVKECVDYPFFNSLDVYFYGSFSLMYLLPELDGKVMEAFSDAILAADGTIRRYWEYEDKPYAELIDSKYEGIRAVRGAVIHDLGSPFDINPDAYSWHNVKEWKDLAPKYILMVYRHYQRTKNVEVVKYCWPAVKESIRFLSGLIEEGDTLPLTHGTDDTFDNLSSHGISIYCASLWAAGLKVAAELAKIMGEESLAGQYSDNSQAALTTLERSLWDERKGYYHFFVTPIQAKHLTGSDFEPLASIGLILSGDEVADKNILNAYLDDFDCESSLSRIEQRLQKKKILLNTAPLAFTREYQVMILDSDNSFGDALVADTYLKLVGADGLFPADRVCRSLDFLYETNFILNSPNLGVANMTLSNGLPHEAFQAQDVWGGIQFSVATALKMSGKNDKAETLLNTVYNTLYHSAKIPFAAPEGFNCSVPITVEDLSEEFQVSDDMASGWYCQLKAISAIKDDGRVSPDLAHRKPDFLQVFAPIDHDDVQVSEKLYIWLVNRGMRYTAGRYFRPGMIFSYLYK